jgi:hypothetical protein
MFAKFMVKPEFGGAGGGAKKLRVDVEAAMVIEAMERLTSRLSP